MVGNLLVTSRSPRCRQNRVSDLPRVTKVVTQNSSLGLSGRSPSDVTAAHRPYCVLRPHYTGTNAFPIGGYATGNPSRARRSQTTPLSAIPESPCVSQDAISIFPHSHPSLLESAQHKAPGWAES